MKEALREETTIGDEQFGFMPDRGTTGATNLGEIAKKVQESRLKWYGHTCIEKRRRMRKEESDGDGGAGGKKERKTK